MATKYDPDVLQKYADDLYRRAAWLIGRWCVLGLIVGVVAFGVLLNVKVQAGTPGAFAFLILAGLVTGLLYGRSQAFQLRLEAQRTLCQVQIERNTRPERLAEKESANTKPKGS